MDVKKRPLERFICLRGRASFLSICSLFFSPFFKVLLLIYGWQGFIRCEASEYNESGEKKWCEGEGGDIFRVLAHWNHALAQWCFGNSTFGIFRKPELALPRSFSFFNHYTNVHHNPPILRIPKSSASFLAQLLAPQRGRKDSVQKHLSCRCHPQPCN